MAQIVEDKAQVAFRRCLTSYFQTGSWVPEDVDAYRNAEADLEWSEAKAELDALLTADHSFHQHIGEQFEGCDDCHEEAQAWWHRMGSL